MDKHNLMALNRDNGACLILRKMGTTLGYECDITNNITDTLRAAHNKTYRIVLIGCSKYDRECWVALEAIKMLHRDRPCPLFIGIIPYPDEELRRRCESTGMAAVLAGPVFKAELAACLERVLSDDVRV